MTDKQKDFLRYAVIEQLKYADIETKLGIKREIFTPWWDEFKAEREYLARIRRKWKDKCPEIDFNDFKDWFEKTEKKCHYCDITEHEIEKLWLKYPNLTKRNRGKSLEIERKKPNKPYNITENLVFSCYWCNNAKTDTFTELEFKKIGNSIKKIWKARLNDNG